MSKEISPVNDSMTFHPELAQRIQDELGQNVFLCYQCVKCTSGCPLSEFFDWQPNQIMRAVQLGQEDIALESETPWLCAACQTCTTRCPQNLDITGIMEFLTREALERGVRPAIPEMNRFCEAFMREVRLWGRAYEPGLMAELALRNPQRLVDDRRFFLRMLLKRKVALLPGRGRPPRKAKPVPGAAEALAYYPGCSLHSSATELDVSAIAVCAALDMNLIEPKGWVCCGSSAAHRVDPVSAIDLPLKNLTLIEQSGFKEVVMPCAACFNRHKTAQYEIRQQEQYRAQPDEVMGYVYQDSVHVSTLSEAILNHVGTEELAARVKRPLTNLKVVSYYGCLLTRPPQVTGVEHPENPTDLDDLLRALGAEVLDWSYKTVCCGGVHSLTRPDIVVKLSGEIVRHAREAGAEAIVVACPLCQMNLDARQFQMDIAEPMPILYFTQLMALALMLPEKMALWHKNLVAPQPLLQEKGFL